MWARVREPTEGFQNRRWRWKKEYFLCGIFDARAIFENVLFNFFAVYLGLPHEPKFEYVRATSALYVFVTGVVRRIVKFVFLEKILGAGRIAVGEHSLVFGQERRTLLGRGEHFMRVPRNRIGSRIVKNVKERKSKNLLLEIIYIFIAMYIHRYI